MLSAAEAVDRTDNEQADAGISSTESVTVMASLRESREQMLEQLEQASSPQEKRAVIEQWRQKVQPLIEEQRALRNSERSTRQSRAQVSPANLTRPEIPEDLPADQRERLELSFDLREARMAMLSEMEGGSPQERRAAIEKFREENTERMTRLRELSERSGFSQVHARSLADSRGLQRGASSSATNNSGNAEAHRSRPSLEALPIPDDLPAAQKARLQVRNDRIDALNELNASLKNASPGRTPRRHRHLPRKDDRSTRGFVG